VKAKRRFLEEKKMTTFIDSIGSHTVVAVEPMVLYNPNDKEYVPVAMGVVAIDSSVATMGLGDVLIIFSEAFIWLAFFGLILAVLLYRITLKPLEMLNNEIDKSLKGQFFEGFTRVCKFQELGQLQDILESILRRLSALSPDQEGDAQKGAIVNLEEECVPSFRMIGETFGQAMVLCDHERRVVYLNPVFEELTGIRADNATMQPLVDQARDEAFASLLTDLFDRANSSNDRLTEAMEFSGVPHMVSITMLGPLGGPARGFVILAVRSSDA